VIWAVFIRHRASGRADPGQLGERDLVGLEGASQRGDEIEGTIRCWRLARWRMTASNNSKIS